VGDERRALSRTHDADLGKGTRHDRAIATTDDRDYCQSNATKTPVHGLPFSSVVLAPAVPEGSSAIRLGLGRTHSRVSRPTGRGELNAAALGLTGARTGAHRF
jgi:hypothetical protein